MIARLLVVMAFALPSPAAAQDLHVPGRLDLNGLWELTEHGAIVDGPAIVRITHSGSSVHAEFIAGACQAIRYSTSSRSPASGQTRKSRSGACSAK